MVFNEIVERFFMTSVGTTFWEEMKRELWEQHFKDPIVVLDKALKSVENPYQGSLLIRDLSWNWSSMACGREFTGTVPKMWDTFV